MTTGERMKARRKSQGIRAEEVAMALHVSPASVYRYENGDIEKVPSSYLDIIADVLNTSVAYLMGWTDSPEPNRYAVEERDSRDDDLALLESIYSSLNKSDRQRLVSLIQSGPLSPEDSELLNAFHQLDPLDRGQVIGTARTLLNQEKYQRYRKIQKCVNNTVYINFGNK